MAYTVFFKEANQVFTVDNFIADQLIGHQGVLRAVADELALRGTISHPQASKNSKGDWSILLNDNGDVFVFTLFISKLEREDTNTEVRSEAPKKQDTLVIVDPSGPRDSVGGYHPGYWSVQQYVNFVGESQVELFKHTVHQIERNIPSDNYSVNDDGSLSIHIQKMGNTSTISLICRAKWI